MKTYHVSYSFDIKDRRTEQVVFWKRDGFDMDVKKGETIDSDVVKARIHQLAKDETEGHPTWFVSYANYFAITEVPKGKRKKAKA